MSKLAKTASAATHFGEGALPKIAYGKGSYLYDTTGKRYLDGSGGPAVFCLGHGNEEVNDAIKAQLDRVAHGYRYAFTSDPLEELSEIVAWRCGGGLTRMVFVSGGSEAVESCLKLALQYHSAKGEMTRRRFISRQRSWHGNTLGALAISGFRDRRLPFEGALTEASFLSAVNEYRPPKGVKPEDVASFCADELEREILRLGPDRVAAFIFEPVVGAAGGAIPAPAGYAKKIRAICDRYGVLMIADEVMCGAARCGTWRALEHDGVEPDIMSVAKGLAGGYMPLGAAVYHERIAGPIIERYGAPLTGHTFTGHTASCAAGVAVQKIVTRDRLVERVASEGAKLKRRLEELLGPRNYVGNIRGRGFFLGIELVADKETKEPFDPALQVSNKIRERSFANGLICYPTGGNVDGIRGDQIILAPPYNASAAELDEIVTLLDRSLTEVMEKLGR
ncbi:MAG TPA: aspartate aminotransferase family protein [Hypericibacter adhaerens]|uniref:Adenosylmethionine-8-amino-7-oxononanoate aminotransferase n=1 Tax=Hypericibacter adhaerens TaxID=2602016 RepID=A0A5J6N4F0_9PROT|nr:aspartate aminotransferase family protein [Hypericibacter adhaerens]QEX24307.1 adenosylmethionine-8-amino-7-oxononanoate aminotransferase [Hypericibacter adhaerens]HWA43029.1 aspartate aminotransferase family protein [Hypericibacter adhaerens]